MRGKGINSNTGFLRAGGSTHEPFDPEIVRREMAVIHDDLRCNAVRITGGDLERLKIAASHAASAGLEVWLSPFTTDLTADELLALLADCAEHAEMTLAKISTWPALAWSRCSKAGWATPTPTWRGSRRPRLPPWPTTTDADWYDRSWSALDRP